MLSVIDENSITTVKPPKKVKGTRGLRVPHSNSVWFEFETWRSQSPYTEPPRRVVLSRTVVNDTYIRKEAKHHIIKTNHPHVLNVVSINRV
jgi:hypothetical protein